MENCYNHFHIVIQDLDTDIFNNVTVLCTESFLAKIARLFHIPYIYSALVILDDHHV
jgi:hypothetical protein